MGSFPPHRRLALLHKYVDMQLNKQYRDVLNMLPPVTLQSTSQMLRVYQRQTARVVQRSCRNFRLLQELRAWAKQAFENTGLVRVILEEHECQHFKGELRHYSSIRFLRALLHVWHLQNLDSEEDWIARSTMSQDMRNKCVEEGITDYKEALIARQIMRQKNSQ